GPEPRVLEVAIRAKRRAGSEDQTAGALTRRDPERAVVLVTRAGPLAKEIAVAARLAQRDECHVAAADLARALGDAAEPGREIERGVDAADHVREQLGLALAAPRFLVEVGVLDGDGRLVGQEPRELLFLVREYAAAAEHHDQRADRAVVVDQWQRDARVQI